MIRAIYLIVATVVIEATSVEDSPIEKVLTMLGDLQAEVVTEGKAEAETYDKFACFCKDVTEEKSKAITDGSDEKSELEATINTETSKRDELDEKVNGFVKRLGEIEEEVKEAMDSRHAEKLEFDKNVLDMEGALQALESAIEQLKASKPTLLQIKSIQTSVRKAMVMADALGLTVGSPKSQKALSAMMIHQRAEVPDEVYEFHSQEIIDILEGLLKDFKSGKTTLDEEEVKAVEAHEKMISALEEEKESKTKEMEDAKAEKATAQETIAEKSGELSTISATLLDDQEYLKDLSAKCNEKAKLWDERTAARSDELGAISQAISIIKGLTKKEEPALVQIHTVHEKDVALHSALGFLQLESKPHLSAISSKQSETAAQEVKRDAIVSLLRSEAKVLKSGLLNKLAQRVAADPFAKVKKLIQELIERLLQEAADEASHKGWCDKEMGKAKQTRGYKVEEIEKLNQALAGAEALRNKLTEEVDTLKKEVEKLGTGLDEATELREKEKKENEDTIKESKEAKEAVGEAIKVLKDFYEKNSFLQYEHPAFLQREDPPDAGFDGAYKGKGDKAGGIVGMLEVVQSDFERTEKETEKAEAQAAKDFIEFERTTKVSKKTKEIALESTESQLKETEGTIETDKESLIATQKSLDSALKELQELHEACVDTGASYEEKKAQREQELEALKKALCILDKQGPVQTEDC
jgi:chromosome segregation ATPase